MSIAPAATLRAEAPVSPAPAPPEPRAGRRLPRLNLRLAIAACLALAALSLIVPYTLDYDPWNWLTWGRELGHLSLDTRGGSAWKPLPVMFTTVLSLAGAAAPALWVLVARAGALIAVVVAYRLGTRLAGPLAGAIAALSLALVDHGLYYFYLGNSEGLLVAFSLAAIDRHLARRPTQALLLAFVAGLLRPEVWPFFALYAVVLWRRRATSRRVVVALLVALPALWLGPEWWASGSPFGGSQRVLASLDAQELRQAGHPWLVVLGRAVGMLPVPTVLGAVAGVALAARHRDRTLLALAAGAGAWVGIVALMAERGYPGIPRFMVPAAAIACVLAGVAAARARDCARAGRPRRVALAAVLASGLVAAVAALPGLREQAITMKYQIVLEHQLLAAVRRMGPDRIVRCGAPQTPPLQVAALDWALGHRRHVDHYPDRSPMVVFRARSRHHGLLLPKVPRHAHLRLVARAGPRIPGSSESSKLRAAAGWRVLENCRPARARPA